MCASAIDEGGAPPVMEIGQGSQVSTVEAVWASSAGNASSKDRTQSPSRKKSSNTESSDTPKNGLCKTEALGIVVVGVSAPRVRVVEELDSE